MIDLIDDLFHHFIQDVIWDVVCFHIGRVLLRAITFGKYPPKVEGSFSRFLVSLVGFLGLVGLIVLVVFLLSHEM